MTRIKINARRIFSLLIPFFFFTSVHAEQTAAPAKPVTVEAKNETFAPQHPDQYLSWKATSEQSERVDALAEDPRLVILWAGYPFSRDYNKPRGHAFAVTDVRETLRTGAPKNAEDGPLPMACWSCKSPDVARLIQKDGEDGYFHGKWARGGPEIVNNLGCADCHNTASPEFAKGKPELTLSRPYAARAMEAIGKPFEKAGRFDQQSMVCGQCHVEYYFDGKNKAVKFPWDDGMKVENMEQYYDKIAFSDWTNSLSKTPMLKAQHPEYETWTAAGAPVWCVHPPLYPSPYRASVNLLPVRAYECRGKRSPDPSATGHDGYRPELASFQLPSRLHPALLSLRSEREPVDLQP